MLAGTVQLMCSAEVLHVSSTSPFWQEEQVRYGISFPADLLECVFHCVCASHRTEENETEGAQKIQCTILFVHMFRSADFWQFYYSYSFIAIISTVRMCHAC